MIEELFDTMDDAISAWDERVPVLEKAFYNRLLDDVKQLDTKNGNIVVSVKNLRLLNKIKQNLKNRLVTKEYLSDVTDFVKVFDKTDKIQLAYFSEIEKGFEPGQIIAEIKKQAIDDTIELLAGSGINSNVLQPVSEILTQDIQSGSSWSNMVKALDDYINGSKEVEARLKKYTGQIVTDSIHQYNAQYSKTITDDLELKWFQYVGGKVKDSRPLCVACVNKRWIHESELPNIVKGVVNGKQTERGRNGLPLGQIPGTNATNFQVLRGGYNCQHLLIPVSENAVPEAVKKRIESK